METKTPIAVIGGDKRLFYAAERLHLYGYTVTTCFMDDLYKTLPARSLNEAKTADILLFGLPMMKAEEWLYAPYSAQKISIKDILEIIRPGQFVAGGNIPADFACEIKMRGASSFDYNTDETFIRYNAKLTAEALAGILINMLPCALYAEEFAVIGYGRIGRWLSHLLHSFGARVTVFARSEQSRDEARASALQTSPISAFSDKPRCFRALINTVPAQVIGDTELYVLNKDCLLIEAASLPYGIDKKTADEFGFQYVLASGLPGKKAPQSAGEMIADTLIRNIREVNYHGPA